MRNCVERDADKKISKMGCLIIGRWKLQIGSINDEELRREMQTKNKLDGMFNYRQSI